MHGTAAALEREPPALGRAVDGHAQAARRHRQRHSHRGEMRAQGLRVPACGYRLPIQFAEETL